MSRLTDLKPIGRNPARLLSMEEQAIIDYYLKHQEYGYLYLTYKMIADDIVCASPSSVYRCLKRTGLLMRWSEEKASATNRSCPNCPMRNGIRI